MTCVSAFLQVLRSIRWIHSVQERKKKVEIQTIGRGDGAYYLDFSGKRSPRPHGLFLLWICVDVSLVQWELRVASPSWPRQDFPPGMYIRRPSTVSTPETQACSSATPVFERRRAGRTAVGLPRASGW